MRPKSISVKRFNQSQKEKNCMFTLMQQVTGSLLSPFCVAWSLSKGKSGTWNEVSLIIVICFRLESPQRHPGTVSSSPNRTTEQGHDLQVRDKEHCRREDG